MSEAQAIDISILLSLLLPRLFPLGKLGLIEAPVRRVIGGAERRRLPSKLAALHVAVEDSVSINLHGSSLGSGSLADCSKLRATELLSLTDPVRSVVAAVPAYWVPREPADHLDIQVARRDPEADAFLRQRFIISLGLLWLRLISRGERGCKEDGCCGQGCKELLHGAYLLSNVN